MKFQRIRLGLRINSGIVTANVLVPVGITLTVEPGTKVAFEDGTKMVVRGTLNAVGVKDNRITFTSNSDSWVGIETDVLSNLTLSYCNISLIQVGLGPNFAHLEEERQNKRFRLRKYGTF